MNLDAPVFQQDGSLSLYWLEGAAAIAYLPSAGSPLGQTLTLEQTWADRLGCYLLLDTRPPDSSAALVMWRDYLQRMGSPGMLRVVWLRTGGELGGWQAWALQVGGTSAAAQLVMPAVFQLAPSSLFLGQGSAVGLSTAADGWGLTVRAAEGKALLWQTPLQALVLAAGVVHVPFTGAAAGCLCFGLPVSDFNGLGAGVSYFYDDSVRVDSRAEGVRPTHIASGYVRQLFLPLFQGAQTVSLDSRIDPCQPDNTERTHFAFPVTGAVPTLDCTLATPRGHRITLTPQVAADARPAARLVFQRAAIYQGDGVSAAHYRHLVPEGGFTLNIALLDAPLLDAAERATPPAWAPVERLVCGASGLEYIGLSAASGCTLVFKSGQAGYAVNAGEGLMPAENSPPLGALCQTAWVQVLAPAGGAALNYFSQPEQAPLYGATTISAQDAATPAPAVQSFVYFNELPSVQLQATLFYPLAPYRGLLPHQVAHARRVEANGVAPARRNAIIPAPTAPRAQAAVLMKSVTPQGLLITWDRNQPTDWSSLVLGRDIDPVAQQHTQLEFTQIRDQFRTALQTNRLMLVAANPEAFALGGSVRYGPKADTFAQLLADTPADPIYTRLAAWYHSHQYPESDNEAAFQAQLQNALGATIDPPHFEALRLNAGLLNAKISGWNFPFSPWTWAPATAPGQVSTSPGTLVIHKFAPGRLSDLANDPGIWAWREVASFGGSPQAVRDKLQATIRTARERHAHASGKASPYAHFIHQVVDNPSWSGVLVLDCKVPLSRLPKPLECLAGGIDPTHFAAHHLGLNATAFQVATGDIQLAQTSMFGLIDYQATSDLHLEPSPDASYAYQVSRLTVGFRNSAISSFACRVQLLVPRLFGSQVTLRDSVRGNSLLLDGTFQRAPGAGSDADGTYVFALVGENLFDVTGSVLTTVRIERASFAPAASTDTRQPDARVHAQFRLGGQLTFAQFSEFDVLGYGPGADLADAHSGLGFDNFLLNLSFPYYHPQQPATFVEQADALSVDTQSVARNNALVRRFPVRLAGLMGVPDKEGPVPHDLGYVSADTPLPPSRLQAPWWGIVYEIDLGTGGALSNDAPLTLKVLAAWADQGVRDESPPLFIGVRLPGLQEAVGVNLPFESFLRLGFRSIKFSTYTQNGQLAYLLRFRRFLIGVMGLSFPPGNMDIVLFGNPDETKAQAKVGWYAAYSAEDDEKHNKIASPERLRLAARRGRVGRD